jgi:hypothetical protein
VSDCGLDHHSDQTWTPATRCRRRGCGHRTGNSTAQPVATRRLPLRYWLFELAARWVATHPVRELEPRPLCLSR